MTLYWVHDNGCWRVWRDEWKNENWVEFIYDELAFWRLQTIAKEFPNLIGKFEEYREDVRPPAARVEELPSLSSANLSSRHVDGEVLLGTMPAKGSLQEASGAPFPSPSQGKVQTVWWADQAQADEC